MKKYLPKSQVGALFGASLATACCWVPLTLAITGVTVAGLSQTLELWAPFFYALTAVLIAYSFWVGFLRKAPECGPCDEESPALTARPARIFFFAHLALVGLILAVPAMMTLSASSTEAIEAPTEDQTFLSAVDLTIGGMDCGGCALTIERTLRNLDGVHAAQVDFAAARAHVTFEDALVSADALASHTAGLGYDVTADDCTH